MRLIEEGERVVRLDEEARVDERRETILRHSGAATGTYPPGISTSCAPTGPIDRARRPHAGLPRSPRRAGDRLCASVVTLADILVEPVRRGAAGPVGEALAALEVVPVELSAGDELALDELRARTGLKLPDCCVLMAARARGASVLSFDERLLRAAELSGIRIAEQSAT